MEMDIEEYFNLSRELEKHHAVFYKFWELGRPNFTTDIPTCAVAHNKDGDYLDFKFNPEFWDKLNNNEKCFILCHECLHVVLEHGKRAVNIDAQHKSMANVAMDLAINQILVSSFGFKRSELPVAKNGCWIDTVFDKNQQRNIMQNGSFEYYLKVLMNEDQNKSQGNDGQDGKNGDGKNSNGNGVLDDHSNLPITDAVNKVLNEISKDLTEDEQKDFSGKCGQDKQRGYQAGTSALGEVFDLAKPIVKKKRIWKSLIKKLNKKWNTDKEDEQWARINRRFAAIDSDMFIPTEHEDEEKEKNMIEVWLYMDYSGSCSSYKDFFLKMALSIPQDTFIIKAFTFDTNIYPVDLKTCEMRGRGGTSFHIIERHIQQNTKKSIYPEAVFVITDGCGTSVLPAKPERWFWFLHGQKEKTFINAKSYMYDLEDIDVGKIKKK